MGAAPYRELAAIYDRVYSWKDYRGEARWIHSFVRRAGIEPARRLLDVGCGTGEHLRHFREWYSVAGIDSSPAMLRIARGKLPGVWLRRAEMTRLRAPGPVDVLTCLFSAIGYLRSEGELLRAFREFHRVLRPGGVALIEPWLAPEEYVAGSMHLLEYRSPSLLVARMNVSNRHAGFSVMDQHHLVGDGRRVRHLVETHRLRLSSRTRLVELLRIAGFRAEYRKRVWPRGRGLLVARKPVTASRRIDR